MIDAAKNNLVERLINQCFENLKIKKVQIKVKFYIYLRFRANNIMFLISETNHETYKECTICAFQFS